MMKMRLNKLLVVSAILCFAISFNARAAETEHDKHLTVAADLNLRAEKAASPVQAHFNPQVKFDKPVISPEMQNNNMMYLAIQTRVQNLSQQTQMVSNIMKADSDAKANAVRNMRDGASDKDDPAQKVIELPLATELQLNDRGRILRSLPDSQADWCVQYAAAHALSDPKKTLDWGAMETDLNNAFPNMGSEQKIKMRLLLLQIQMGDVAGALRSMVNISESRNKEFNRLLLEKLDKISEEKSKILQNFAKQKPPRAYAGSDPQGAVRSQDKSAKYTQWVQVNTQLMSEVQNTERELLDTLSQMRRQEEELWEAYASIKEAEARTTRSVVQSMQS